MIVVKEHASTVRNRTGKVRFARAMPTTNPRTGMLWERDCRLMDHRCAGLEFFFFGGGGDLPDSCRRREDLKAGSRGIFLQKILKNRVFLMPFPAFWCGFLCMEQVTNEKKILRILVKQNMNRKISLINISD